VVPSTLLRSLREAWEVPRDLLLGRYPPFVTGGPLPRGHVPVFVFHSLEPVSFERKLRHLAENGYVTLSGEEYLAVIRRESLAPQRAVLLTFDDGRRSVSTVGEPILARYGMRGVVFLVPGRMAEKATSAAAEEPDATSGQHADGTRSRPETPDEGLLSWQEVLPLVRTGHLSFQSHTLTHARIHTSAALLGFVTPEMRRGYAAFDLPALRSGGRDLLGEEVPLGSPVFESLPRLAETLRFFEDEAARQRCHDVADGVARSSGPSVSRPIAATGRAFRNAPKPTGGSFANRGDSSRSESDSPSSFCASRGTLTGPRRGPRRGTQGTACTSAGS
jgi:hypothetical protein